LRVPLPDSAGGPEVRDEVLQLGQSFNTMLDRIEEAFKAQQQSESRARRFAADASHEMRSPLTVIGGYLDVLLMGAKDDRAETERILLAMQRENNRLGRLVVDLLLLARIDANAGSVLRLQPVQLDEVAERAVANISLVAGERDVRAVVSGGQARVTGDADQLYRVLTNLLDNAIRYTGPKGKITVAVEADVEQGQVSVSVTDDGSGIPAEELPRIFDRFYRADPSRTRDTGNAGLGLSICKSIVEAHGGCIGATSEPGRGTSVTFELPLHASSPAILSRF
jgi:two-component system OmpR family sensor kinase